MYAVIYQGHVISGKENEYKKYWHIIASYFIEHCGALGSCLHKTEKGLWLAYSRWPDKMTYEHFWPDVDVSTDHPPKSIELAIARLK